MLDLLVNTTRPGTAVAEVAQLNAQAIKLIAQGQVVRMLSQSPVPVAPGSVLQLQLVPGASPHITRIDLPTILPQELRTFIARALTAQGSPAPLLQLLQRSLSVPSGTHALPEGIRHLGQQLLALLPSEQTLRQPGVLAGFLHKSGLFLESSLANAAREAMSADGALSEGDDQTKTSPEKAGGSFLRLMGQLREQLRAGSTNEKAEPADTTPDNTGKGAEPASANARPGVSLPSDYKALLLQLQQQLNAAKTQPSQSTNVSPQGNASAPSPATSGNLAITSVPNGGTAAISQTAPPGSPGVESEDVAGGNSAETKTGSLGTQANTSAKGLPPDKTLPALDTPTADGPEADLPAATTSNSAHPRLARAADQYQRMEQLTRPASPARPVSGETVATEDTQAIWTEMATEMDIPGLGLPLPHRQKQRNDAADDGLDNLVGLLLKRTQESLNRLHLHQLSQAGATTRESAQATQNAPLTFDLPLFFDGQVQVFNTRIEEEELPSPDPSTPEKKVRQWSVSLGFDIEGLGPMFCQLKMQEQQAQLQFWADRPATLALTRANLGFLSKSLHELGVSVSEVSCHEGMPKQPRTRLSQQLVDINT